MAILKHFDVIYGYTIDYMHAVLIGVAKYILGIWVTGAKYMKGKDKVTLNNRLLAIKPCSFISTFPRNLKDIQIFKQMKYAVFCYIIRDRV